MPVEAEEGEESWAQTLITVTPEENAVIRTITQTTLISAPGDTPLALGVNEIAERRTAPVVGTMRRNMAPDVAELEGRTGTSDAECQTFLQGVPKVELPAALKNEATQTMYLGNASPYAMIPFRNITRIMNERTMPVEEKRTEETQTIVTFDPKASKDRVVDRLKEGITPKQLLEDDLTSAMPASAYVTDLLNFVLKRVFWLSDSEYRVPEVKLKDDEAQTLLRYDEGLGKVFLDADTQTFLTCEPKRSNAGLLGEWTATLEFARGIVEECLEIGVLPRTIVDSILDEVIERCAAQIRLPGKDEIVQTLAPCKALEDKDDEVLRKLRLEVVFDPLESSIIVLPVVGDLLEKVCSEVRHDAPTVVGGILDRVRKNSVSIAVRIAAIREEAISRKPMESIFEERNKMLRESLASRKRRTLSSSTQTGLAGVPDVGKVKEPKETVCSTCTRHSECYICEGNLDDGGERPEGTRTLTGKILRTQDILIAYNPCYVVATPSEIARNQPPPPPVLPKRPPTVQASKRSRLLASKAAPSVSSSSSATSSSVLYPPRSKAECLAACSLDDWTRIVRNISSTSGAWSLRGSSSAGSNATGGPTTCFSKKNPIRGEGSTPPCDLYLRSVNVLRILKDTFNRNEGSCSDTCACGFEIAPRKTSSTSIVCRPSSPGRAKKGEEKDRKIMRESSREEQTPRRSNSSKKPCGEGLRVVPIIHLPNRINKS